MTTSTLTVTDFVTARLDEWYRAALLSMCSDPWVIDGSSVVMRQGSTDTVIVSDGGASPRDLQHIALHDPARVLAQCAAMRKIVDEARDYSPELAEGDNGEWALGMAVRALASIWSDHPDWREEWR